MHFIGRDIDEDLDAYFTDVSYKECCFEEAGKNGFILSSLEADPRIISIRIIFYDMTIDSILYIKYIVNIQHHVNFQT